MLRRARGASKSEKEEQGEPARVRKKSKKADLSNPRLVLTLRRPTARETVHQGGLAHVGASCESNFPGLVCRRWETLDEGG